MPKPQTIDGYSADHTAACERALVTLLRHMGPWKQSIFLVGGLTPRYLVPDREPAPPAHAGTLDIDVVVDLALLTTVDAYRTLERNLKDTGFERGENDDGVPVSWRWVYRGVQPQIVLELLVDAADDGGDRSSRCRRKATYPHSSYGIRPSSKTCTW